MQSYKTIKVPAYIGGVSKQKDFDPICHIELVEEKIANDEDEEGDEDEFMDDSDRMYER